MNHSRKSMWKSLSDIITSMRLTILVLIILACTSILAIIFQNYHPINMYNWQEFYATRLGPFKYRLYSALQLFTPYRSWWFISLLSFLCISLLLCSINRLKNALKFLLARDDFRSNSKISRQKNSYTFKMPADCAVSAIHRALRRSFFKVFAKEGSGTTYLYAKKYSFSRLGPFLSHVGLLSLFAGGLISAGLGKSAMLWGEPGDFIKPPFAQQKLLVDDFEIAYNQKGQVKEYTSSVRLYDQNDNLIMKKAIEVNHPLRYDGLSYYQSSYRVQPRKVKNLMLSVRTKKEAGLDTLLVKFGQKKAIPNSDYYLELASFAADFQITDDGVISKSDQLRNPAFLINYMKGDELISHQWLFARYPSVHSHQDQPIEASFIDFEPMYYTGLQVTKNPGSSFIWAGFLIMSIGLLLVFYFNHAQIWAAVIHNEGSDCDVYIAGTSHKFKEQFKKELDEIVARVKQMAKGKYEKNSSARSHFQAVS